MPPQLPSSERESGLYLEAHFEADLVRIVRSEPISRVARARLRAPMLTEDYADTSKPDAAEIVLSILNAEGARARCLRVAASCAGILRSPP